METIKNLLWPVIKNDFFDDENEVIHIDAWETEDGDEEGKVIAKIHYGTQDVEYIDLRAISDEHAQQVIKQTIARMSEQTQCEQNTNL